jgi:hypothetical protein
MNNGYQKSNGCNADKEGRKFFKTFFSPNAQSKHVRPLAYNGKALAKKGHLEHKCSTLAPKFHSSTKVEFTTSSPFFANAMLCVRLIF